MRLDVSLINGLMLATGSVIFDLNASVGDAENGTKKSLSRGSLFNLTFLKSTFYSRSFDVHSARAGSILQRTLRNKVRALPS